MDPKFNQVETREPAHKIAPVKRPNPFAYLIEKKSPGPGAYKEVEKAKAFT